MTAKLKLNFTRSRYLEIDFEDVTDEKIITHKKMKVTMNLAAIFFYIKSYCELYKYFNTCRYFINFYSYFYVYIMFD